MDRKTLFEQFQSKAGKLGWEVKYDDFPETIAEDFFPRPDDIFNAFTEISFNEVEYVVVGQDPYYTTHKKGKEKIPDAIGIAFAVDKDQPYPPSLKNILKFIAPKDLRVWAKENKILLLNAALTVPDPKGTKTKVAGKHLPRWQKFTHSIIHQLRKRASNPVPDCHFIAWGTDARDCLDDAFRSFSWSFHPAYPTRGEEKSFKKFWDADSIGSKLKS